ncbi:MAG: RNA 2',3'-cyclic phosphodiesterase [Bacillota bacterium]|nr:RNA 2',3'-cyclic phosphodiesterase [Bacillota bacterium]
MRLFIAINFNEQTKDSLCGIMEHLKGEKVSGNYTTRDNLHLTLVFIGEVPSSKIIDIEEAINTIDALTFDIKIGGIGTFKQKDGGILWTGITLNDSLISVYNKLTGELEKRGFEIEKRAYKPHLTLCRRAKMPPEFDIKKYSNTAPEQNFSVEKISLMKSERIGGKLIYTEIYSKILK